MRGFEPAPLGLGRKRLCKDNLQLRSHSQGRSHHIHHSQSHIGGSLPLSAHICLNAAVGNIVLYSPRCSESRCGPECGGVTRVSSEIGVVVCHTCLWTLRDFIRLAPEIGVKHVFVHWRIGRILQRVGRTQKDVLVHPLLSKYNYNVGDQAR